MRIIECKQGTPEWLAARIGKPTASCFDQIVTSKTLKPSASSDKYLAKLLAEWYLGRSLDEATSAFMERGTQLEQEAADWYAFDRNAEVLTVGFVTTDDGTIGASPDRLIGDKGLLEIKCPSAATHMQYWLAGEVEAYWLQVQGQLWVCEREWCDLLSYNPEIPSVVTRIERDKTTIDALTKEVSSFVCRMEVAKQRLRAMPKVESNEFTEAIYGTPF